MSLASLLHLERISDEIYRGQTPPGASFRGIYGGQTIAQSLRAAQLTLPTFAELSFLARRHWMEQQCKKNELERGSFDGWKEQERIVIGSENEKKKNHDRSTENQMNQQEKNRFSTNPENEVKSEQQTPFTAHSLHCYFLLPGDPNEPVLYHVDRVRNGSSFCNRHVKATQHGKAICMLHVSFQKFEFGLEYQDEKPHAPEPEQLPSLSELLNVVAHNQKLDQSKLEIYKKRANLPFPIDERRVTDPYALEVLNATKTKPYCLKWIRALGEFGSNEDLLLHQCAIAYLTDWGFLSVGTQAHGLNHFDGSLFLTTICHSIFFHSPFKANDWHLFEITAPRATNGRSLSIGKLFAKSGKLVVTCTQEGVMRIKKSPSKL